MADHYVIETPEATPKAIETPKKADNSGDRRGSVSVKNSDFFSIAKTAGRNA
jgi:hypothetical protein